MEKQEPVFVENPPAYNEFQGGNQMNSYPPSTFAAQNYGFQQQIGMQQQNAVVVQQPQPNTTMVNPVPDYLHLAIFATICCFWPLGIFAILRAQDARRATERGDVINGNLHAANAKRYSIMAIGFGILSVVPAICVLIWYFTTLNVTTCYGVYC